MFKFLKDKLKGALSSFSKKAEETAKEEVVESSEEPLEISEPEEEPAESPAVETPSELFAAPIGSSSEVEDSTDETAETTEQSVPVKSDSESPAVETPPDISSEPSENSPPSITIQPEKKGFFKRLKEKFVKPEEVAEEKKEPIPEPEQVEDVVIEESEIEVEGSPLRKIKIHDHIEDERPQIEQLFEPIEPAEPKKEKEKKGEPEDYEPKKVLERIKDVQVVEQEPKYDTPDATKSAGESKAQPAKPEKRYIPVERSRPIPVKPIEKPEEKKGFFAKLKQAVTTKKISEQQFEDLFWDVEVALLENNVAVEVIEKIKVDLKTVLVDQPIPRGSIESTILSTLKQSLSSLFDVEQIDLFANIKAKKPYVICFVGINGSGKTTTIAKFAHMLQNEKLGVVMAAADTFRAAAIDQLQTHADKLNLKLIKHDYGSDPAAVAFDAIKHAEAANKDVVLIDTAGRLHSNINLIDEMKKIVRVAKPDLILFIGESITGNDCVQQAQQFDEAVGINGIILSKADIDEKGGAAISVSYVTKKPILYLGTGQNYDDLKKFDANLLIESLGL